MADAGQVGGKRRPGPAIGGFKERIGARRRTYRDTKRIDPKGEQACAQVQKPQPLGHMDQVGVGAKIELLQLSQTGRLRRTREGPSAGRKPGALQLFGERLFGTGLTDGGI